MGGGEAQASRFERRHSGTVVRRIRASCAAKESEARPVVSTRTGGHARAIAATSAALLRSTRWRPPRPLPRRAVSSRVRSVTSGAASACRASASAPNACSTACAAATASGLPPGAHTSFRSQVRQSTAPWHERSGSTSRAKHAPPPPPPPPLPPPLAGLRHGTSGLSLRITRSKSSSSCGRAFHACGRPCTCVPPSCSNVGPSFACRGEG